MFKGAANKGRCLIPADGFYEWKVIPGEKTKQPMHIRLKGGELYAFAGLWTWGGDEIGPMCATHLCAKRTGEVDPRPHARHPDRERRAALDGHRCPD